MLIRRCRHILGNQSYLDPMLTLALVMDLSWVSVRRSILVSITMRFYCSRRCLDRCVIQLFERVAVCVLCFIFHIHTPCGSLYLPPVSVNQIKPSLITVWPDPTSAVIACL